MLPEQISLVKNTWQKVVPIADTAADLFYDRLFELDPSLGKLFQNTDLAAQKKKLLQTLAAAIGSLDALDALAPRLVELGRRHATYGVHDEHYETAGTALLWTLEKGLGKDWKPEAQEAWIAVYTLVAQTMQAGAADQEAQIPAPARDAA